MNRGIAIAALVGFTLSLLVHVAALWGIDASMQYPVVKLLHIGMFVVFIPFVLSCRKTLGPCPTAAEMRAVCPGWASASGVALLFYALLNFFTFAANEHGHLILEITSSQYALARANVMRGFSGHWLLFYYWPFAYFMFGSSTSEDRHRSGGSYHV